MFSEKQEIMGVKDRLSLRYVKINHFCCECKYNFELNYKYQY